MDPVWQGHLEAAGAALDGGGVASFGGDPVAEARVARDGDVLADLSHAGLLAFTGRDAHRFLQTRLTADLRRLDDVTSLPAALCGAEGRVEAVLRLFRRGEALLAVLAGGDAAAVAASLRRAVFRADVAVADHSDALCRCGLSGPGADRLLREALGAGLPPPDGALDVAGAEVTLAGLPGPWPRVELHGPAAALGPLWAALAAAGARPVGREAWAWLDIAAGVPALSTAQAGRFLPQMLGLDALGAVSFDKGCYLGQEAIATLQDRGRLPRAPRRLRAAAPPPAPGTPVFAAAVGEAAGREEGSVVAAAPDPDGGAALLAVVRVDAPARLLRLGAPDGPALVPLAPPGAAGGTAA